MPLRLDNHRTALATSPRTADDPTDFARLCCRLSRAESPFVQRVERFLGARGANLAIEAGEYPLYDLPHIHQAVAEGFGDWKLVAEGGPPVPCVRTLWAPVTTRFEVARGRFEVFMTDGSQFYQLPDGSRRVLAFAPFEHGDEPCTRFLMIGRRRNRDALAADCERLRVRLKGAHYLQGQVLTAEGRILPDFQPRSWDDVALSPEVRETILRNTVEVLRRREAFQRNGVPLKRGLILHGPPGTGKTLVGKALAGMNLGTFIYVTASDASQMGTFRGVFSLARRLRPTIVFLEDMDLFAEERNGFGSQTLLGEMLAQLDGLVENDGLIFIATTNDLTAIDPALRERPSRFDVVLKIGLPALAARRTIVEKNLPAGAVDAMLLDLIAERTDGLSGAHVREVAYLALQRALLRDACHADGQVKPEAEDFAFAVEQLGGARRTILGFQPGRANAN
ncbi:MAG TPA: ATP-binding protein [Pirellulales bacterium]|jgi:hypothetical protein|nr:ATP-binding protein [Pirellulales bacterium]